MSIASYFGLTSDLDAFIIAYTVVLFVNSVFSSAIQTAFIPLITSHLVKGDFNSAQNDLRYSLSFLLVLLSAVIVFLVLFTPTIVKVVSFGFSDQKQLITKSLILLTLPFFFFATCNSLFHAVLQSDKKFWISSVTPIIVPSTVVFFVLLYNSQLGVKVIALGAIIGSLLESLILVLLLKNKGYVALPKFDNFVNQTKVFAKQTWIVVVGATFMATTMLVDQAMASSLGEGSVSALNFGSKVPMLINSLTTMVISTVIFPYYSELVSKKDWFECRSLMVRASVVCIVVLLPVMVILSLMSENIVKIIFERGEFSAYATHLVSLVQAGYFLHIIPFVISIFWVKMLNALGKNNIVSLIAFINLITNIVFNNWFMGIWGVQGIAYATAVVYLMSAILCVLFTYNALRMKLSTNIGEL